MINPDKAEIMAPVGSFASLTAAIQAGADSVYFGVTQLNMRARAAANFNLADLAKIAKKCKQHKVKTYLAVNTLLYDHDIIIMKKLVNAAKKNNLDAIIAFDLATIQYANEIDMPVHMSVQFSLSNFESVKFFAKMTNRVVLARELNLEQIKDIYERIKKEKLFGREGRLMEIEAFAHGALCVAQSGRCYMSLYTHNASANRGACLQNCRARYRVIDEDSGKELIIDNHYVMSAADICTIDFLDKMLASGVQVLKIEGRGRSAEYVYTVTKIYKQALEDIKQRKYHQNIEKYFLELKKVFNRNLSHGNYYLGKEIGEYSDAYGSKATEEKIFIGRVKHFFVKSNILEMQIETGTIKINDKYLIIGNATGVLKGKVKEIRLNDKKVKQAGKNDLITFPTTERVRKNDKVFILKTRKKLQNE